MTEPVAEVRAAREVLAQVLEADGLTLAAEETRAGHPPAEIFTHYAITAMIAFAAEARSHDGECICPTCGLRHGGNMAEGDW